MKKFITALMCLAMLITSLLSLNSCSPEDGADGTIPKIGENGNWWIGDTDTGIRAKGPSGDSGDGGADGTNASDGRNGVDAKAPMFRYNMTTGKIEITYDDGLNWQAVGNISDADKNSSFSYPINQIRKLEGTIADSNNKYIIAGAENGGWHGGLIDLSGMDYTQVRLVKNKNGNELGYTFVTEMFVVNAVPSFATGYSKCVWDHSDSVTLQIPSDAKYMYIYYNSEAAIHLPDSVTFIK